MFLGDLTMAVVLDDRQDVWQGIQRDNLLMVRPYVFFPTTAADSNSYSPSDHHPAVTGLAPSDVPAVTNPSIENNEERHSTMDIAVEKEQCLSPSSEHEVIVEEDNQLLRSLSILQNLHREFYSCVDKSFSTSLSTANILRDMQHAVLRGCHMAFSGIVPTNCQRPQSQELWMLAERLGATVSSQLQSNTTHLLARDAGTHKAKDALDRGDIWLVRVEWLWECVWGLHRADEHPFLLGPPPNTQTEERKVVESEDVNIDEPPTKKARPEENSKDCEEEEEEEEEDWLNDIEKEIDDAFR